MKANEISGGGESSKRSIPSGVQCIIPVISMYSYETKIGEEIVRVSKLIDNTTEVK
jgi:hypothetical protein